MQPMPKMWLQGRRIADSKVGLELNSEVQMWQDCSSAVRRLDIVGMVHAWRRSSRRISARVGRMNGIAISAGGLEVVIGEWVLDLAFGGVKDELELVSKMKS